MQRDRDQNPPTDLTTDLPRPAPGARWRWTTARRAMVGGGVLAATLGLGGVAAGAATPHGSKPPSSASRPANPPGGMGRPTAGGKITALSGDVITIATGQSASETITYSSTTTFRTKSGQTTSADLAVGEFIMVSGTKASDGSVTAKSIMISATAPAQAPGGRPGGPRPSKHGPAAA